MMQPIVLETDFSPLKVIDKYDSLIWTERYNQAGDFEFHSPATVELLFLMIPGRYLYLSESDTLMIIEKIEIKTDADNGNMMIVSGASIASIIARRIVWSQTVLDGYLEGQIQKLLNQNIISPTDADRQIANFIFEASDDSSIEAMTIRSQYTGDNVYKIITEICEDRQIGFKVSFTASEQFAFKLINGKNRTHDQNVNEPVVFSPEFDNLIDSDYVNNQADYKTIALIAGQEQGDSRVRTTIQPDLATGLNRRELYIDARDLQQDEDMTDAEYLTILQQRGNEKMASYLGNESFDASMETNVGPKFGIDFFLGDIVEVQNEYGIGGKCRVIELIRSKKSSGYYEYPTFKML